MEACAGRCGSVCQHAIESGTIKLPAEAIGTEYEFPLVGDIIAPSANETWSRMVSRVKERLPNAKGRQKRARGRGQSLAHAAAVIASFFNERDRLPGTGQSQGRRTAGRSAAQDDDIE
jgi:hypothetical protein